MSEAKKPIDAALDLFVFAPVGLALTAAEEIPKLAEKGRTRISTQLTMARAVGQFAAIFGRKEIERRIGLAGDQKPATTNGPTPAAVASPGEVADIGGETEDSGEADGRLAAETEGDVVYAVTDGSPTPSADGLAIPGYDSLAASQVVQRLAGLSKEELEAVGRYEAAHRSRRTVLTRVRQLQGS